MDENSTVIHPLTVIQLEVLRAYFYQEKAFRKFKVTRIGLTSENDLLVEYEMDGEHKTEIIKRGDTTESIFKRKLFNF